MKKKISPPILVMIIALMTTFIVVQLSVFNFFESDIKQIPTSEENFGIISRLESEAGMYKGLHKDGPAPKLKNRKSKRSKASYMKNRAYMGAPPTIPHSVDEVISEGGFENCLQCHQDGAYSVKMKAYAPIVPHPEYTSCRQCHVPSKTKRLFKETKWKKVSNINKGLQYLPGSPPVIPHSLQLRENCLSCHLNTQAVDELKVTHPERTNCRQCHVETNTVELFKREAK